MRDVDVTIAADHEVSLAGTLTLPTGPGPHPAVLLLHGSGRLDRDGNAGRLRMGLGTALAAALAERGIATLRYDRRGVGASTGDWMATGFIDNRNDAAAALRTLARRDDIRSDAIGVVGHSEGAVHAMALGSEVAAVVLLAGFTRRGEDALRWQVGNIAPKPLLPVLRALLPRIKAGRVFGKRLNARWLREVLDHDPRPHLAAIRVPVLAITGDKDIQVDPTDLNAVRELARGEVHWITDLTHLLRRDPGKPSVRFYPRQLRKPVDADLLTQVADWLHNSL